MVAPRTRLLAAGRGVRTGRHWPALETAGKSEPPAQGSPPLHHCRSRLRRRGGIRKPATGWPGRCTSVKPSASSSQSLHVWRKRQQAGFGLGIPCIHLPLRGQRWFCQRRPVGQCPCRDAPHFPFTLLQLFPARNNEQAPDAGGRLYWRVGRGVNANTLQLRVLDGNRAFRYSPALLVARLVMFFPVA